MCVTCGCSDNAKATVTDLDTGKVVTAGTLDHGHSHKHEHNHTHGHAHNHDHFPAQSHAGIHGKTISLEAEILAKNDRLAERNRGWFEGRNILALNLVSSPGSGKTTLLEAIYLLAISRSYRAEN